MKDQQLILKTKELIRRERKTLAEILEHLREIQKRRLFCDFGHSSLIKFMIKELGYSESAAYRRWSALKITNELPQVKKMIADGSINLTNLGKVQTALLKKSTGQKSFPKKKIIETIKEVGSMTARECELHLHKINPSYGAKKRKLEINEETYAKLDQLKAFTKEYDTDKLLGKILDEALKKADPKQVKPQKSRGSLNPRTIPRSTVMKLHLRAKSTCEYAGCNEIHSLEIEHTLPVAYGGSNVLGNLKLFCKAHNQRAAIKVFGQKKMDAYFRL